MVCWSQSHTPISCIFLLTSYHKTFFIGSQQFACADAIWKAWAPLRCKCFMWLRSVGAAGLLIDLNIAASKTKEFASSAAPLVKQSTISLLGARSLLKSGRASPRLLDCDAAFPWAEPPWKTTGFQLANRSRGSSWMIWKERNSIFVFWCCSNFFLMKWRTILLGVLEKTIFYCKNSVVSTICRSSEE